MVKNYMEILVDNFLLSLIQHDAHLLACEKCQDDIRAIALNHLKPIYVVTEKGSLYAKINEFSQQFQVDVKQEIIKAVEKVKSYPQHD